MKRLPLLFPALLAAWVSATAAPVPSGPQGFYRQPALRGDQLVFLSQGDLWRVSAHGGAAQRLTAHPGTEAWPVLLPDGRTLAFVAQIESSGDVYTLPLEGGVAQRRTWLSTPQLRLWGSDAQGQLLLTAPALDGRPVTQAFRLVGERLEALPVGAASDLALSLDGRRLYFTRHGLRNDNAKAYRGGAMPQLWVLDLGGTQEAQPLRPDSAGGERRPMPYRDAAGQERVAFLSDRDGIANLWSARPDGSDLRAHTAWKAFDIRHASVDGGVAVVARGADLLRVDLNGPLLTDAQPLPITLAGDHSAAAPRWLRKTGEQLGGVAVAPNGERLVMAVRGQLATQGVQALRRALLQQAPDAASRCQQPTFSHDGRAVFAFCDFSGEQEIWRLDALGQAAPQRITRDGQLRRRELAASPDGRWLAHASLDGRLFITDLQAKDGPSTREFDRVPVGDGPDNLRWHPDGQALVYGKNVNQPSYRNQLWLYSPLDGKARALTSERYNTGEAAFSPDGQWLYFSSQRHLALQERSAVWYDRNMGPSFDPAWRVYALALQPGLRPPFAPKDELGGEAGKPKAEAGKLPRLVLDGLAERLHELPLPPGVYRELATDGRRLWWLDAESGMSGTLRSAALEPGMTAETHSERVRHYALSANGKTLLLRREGGSGSPPELLLMDAGAKAPGDLSKVTVRWSDWALKVDPRQEWQQLFDDAWRLQRDHAVAANVKAADWEASRRRHAPLLARVGDRSELAELMGQMASDLGLLHSQIVVTDYPPMPEEAPPQAGLGAQLEPAPEGGARIVRLYRGDPELVGERGPLLAPGLDIQEGDRITALNGRALQWPQGSTLLLGEAGRQMRLTVQRGSAPPRDWVVLPVDPRKEFQLRYQDWRTRRAQQVEQLSQGRVGYLHLRAMGPQDIADFARDFYAQLDKEALIIDVRFNNGGSIDSWILEKLMRRAWSWWTPRHPAGGARMPNMQQSFNGPLAVLINEQTYSDGETFAEGVRRLKLGTLVGKTTAGAGVWLTDSNRLMDGGLMRAAEWPQVDAQGRQLIEGVGVKPDLEVDDPPRASFQGQDRPLEAAVRHLLQQLPGR